MPKLTDGLFYIRQLKDLGYSFNQIAELAGVSSRSVFNWYHGDRQPHDAVNSFVKAKLQPVFRKITDQVEPKGQVVYNRRRHRTGEAVKRKKGDK